MFLRTPILPFLLGLLFVLLKKTMPPLNLTYQQFRCFIFMNICLSSFAVFAQIGIHGDVIVASGSTVGFITPSVYFINGVVQNSASTDATVFLGPQLIWEDAGHNSHIDMQIALDNNEEFILPLGNAQVFHPLAIHAAANTAVTARYFDKAPLDQQLDASLTQLANFYWSINADQPLSISLTWNALSGINQLTNTLEALAFVGYDGSKWESIPAEIRPLDLLTQGPSSLNVGSITSSARVDFSNYSLLSLATIKVETDLQISDAFSPNGDGINDVWYILNANRYPQMEIHVYNRWGSEVFSSSNGYNNNWTGHFKDRSNLLPSAPYYYQIDQDGDGRIDQQGWVYINY